MSGDFTTLSVLERRHIVETLRDIRSTFCMERGSYFSEIEEIDECLRILGDPVEEDQS